MPSLMLKFFFSLRENMIIVLFLSNLLRMMQRRSHFIFSICGVGLPNFTQLLKEFGSSKSGSKMFQIVNKLKLLKRDIKKLNAEKFGDVSINYT